MFMVYSQECRHLALALAGLASAAEEPGQFVFGSCASAENAPSAATTAGAAAVRLGDGGLGGLFQSVSAARWRMGRGTDR
ncbi:hypothetical protein C8R43DRAFT_983306 [Mycena crocata]|nr:hypothetical protein C8R43DRAFT_983306 [Mycena crocata]